MEKLASKFDEIDKMTAGSSDRLINSLDALKKDITAIDNSDIEFLFLDLKQPIFFKEILGALAGLYKSETGHNLELNLVFNIDDFGKDLNDKKNNLRRLKALLEYPPRNTAIDSIVVKGKEKEETVVIEPNVFSSGIKFEKL